MSWFLEKVSLLLERGQIDDCPTSHDIDQLKAGDHVSLILGHKSEPSQTFWVQITKVCGNDTFHGRIQNLNHIDCDESLFFTKENIVIIKEQP